MVHRCCISSCGMNVRVAEAKGLSYHSFPSKELIREQWVHVIRPHLEKPDSFKVVPGYTRVCSRHFRKKDYSLDIKKRARLNSNAVPSVFPRKSSPLVVQSVIPASPTPEVSKPKSSPPQCLHPSTTATILGNTVTLTLPNPTSCSSESDATTVSKELLIESATITDDQLILTVHDNDPTHPIEEFQYTNEDRKVIRQDKKRKRRKWNRTAFARPAKGKKKNEDSSLDESNIDGVGEALAEISLSTLLAITPDIQELADNFTHSAARESNLQVCISDNQSVKDLTSVALQPIDVSLLSLDSDQVPTLNCIEQELLQSIQAVRINSGEPEHESLTNETLESLNLSSSLVPHCLQHQNQESLLLHENSLESTFSVATSSDKIEFGSAELDDHDLLPNLNVDLRIPTVSEIEQLAQDLNSSLLTSGNLGVTLDDIPAENPWMNLLPLTSPAPESPPSTSHSSAAPRLTRAKSGTTVKSVKTAKPLVESPKFPKIVKKAKREKMLKGFTVERFQDNDKDIEYYTGFNSYRNFEAFFRSLEAHIDKLKVTDMMSGVSNLTNLNTDNNQNSHSTVDNTMSNDSVIRNSSGQLQAAAPEEPKRHTYYQGRSMSRIDELFMTVMRLKRKLPEKVLGHMFYISQPTVSRIVRAWTMLLSKLIDSYPSENNDKSSSSNSCKPITEHNYTSRGLGIPDSFRQLFHSDLANQIVLTTSVAKKPRDSNGVNKRIRKQRLVPVDSEPECSVPDVVNTSVTAEGSTPTKEEIPYPSCVVNPCSEVEVVEGQFFDFAFALV